MKQNELGKPVSYGIALVYVGLGDDAQALEWLDHGRATGDTSMPFVHLEKRFAGLRQQTTLSAKR